MSARERARWGVARAAAAAALVVAVGGAAVAGRGLLLDEATQAEALVAEGRRDFARNDRAAAILAFERARRFAPRSAAGRAELTALGVRDAEPTAARALGLITSAEWAAIATASGWIAGLALALILLRRRRGGVAWVSAAAGLTCALATTGVVAAAAWSPAIVAGAGAELLLAPYPAAASAGALPGGTMVLLGSRYAAFVHVETGDGAAGWTTAAAVQPIARPPD